MPLMLCQFPDKIVSAQGEYNFHLSLNSSQADVKIYVHVF